MFRFIVVDPFEPLFPIVGSFSYVAEFYFFRFQLSEINVPESIKPGYETFAEVLTI